MATRTASVSGLASLTATWGGAAVPVSGDIIVVNQNITVTWDLVGITLGASVGFIGHAMNLVAGTSGTPGGKLIVNSGITLTLAGNDRASNTCGIINAFAEFAPAAGSTILFDVSADGKSILINNGILTITGVTVSIPAARINWNTAGSGDTGSLSNQGYYDAVNNIMAYPINSGGISNAGGTALGSLGDTSLSFASQAPAGIIATEKASIALCTAAGHYYVDYTNGIVYWYNTGTANFRFIATYKTLSFFGITIQSFANAAGNQVTFTNNTVSYLGNLSGGSIFDDFFLYCKNKGAGLAGVSRGVTITGNTFNFCKRVVGLTNCIGTSGTNILLDDNKFIGTNGDLYGLVLGLYRASNSYVSMQRNTGGVYSGAVYTSATSPIILCNGQAGVVQTNDHWTVKDNAFLSAQFLDGGVPDQFVWPDSVIDYGLTIGIGGSIDSRGFTNFGGTSGHQAIIQNHISWRAMRIANMGSYETIQDCVLGHNYHHTINGPTSQLDVLITSTRALRNISIEPNGSSFYDLGYNKRQAFDDAKIEHNTIYKSGAGNSSGPLTGVLAFGDSFDGVGPNVGTNVTMSSNLIKNSISKAVYRGSDVAGWRGRWHVPSADYNAIHGSLGTIFSGLNRFATFAGITNITGCALYNPSSAVALSGKVLDYVYTSASVRTLAWDGGVPVSIVRETGAISTTAVNGSAVGLTAQNGTLIDSSRAWNTAQNNAACPSGDWIVMTSGVASGQVRRIINTLTAGSATVVPAWSAGALPVAGDTYVIIKAEVTLTASGATTVVASLDARSLPTSSQTDSTVSMTLNGVSSDPQLVDPTRTLATWDLSLGGAGTEEAAVARIFAAPTLTRTSLMPYLRAGFMPQNAAYATAAHDGTTIGAVQYVASLPNITALLTGGMMGRALLTGGSY